MSNSYIPPDLPIPASVVDPERGREEIYCANCDMDYWEWIDEGGEEWDGDFCPKCQKRNEQQEEV